MPSLSEKQKKQQKQQEQQGNQKQKQPFQGDDSNDRQQQQGLVVDPTTPPPLSEVTLDLLKELKQAAEEEENVRVIQDLCPRLLFQDRLDSDRGDDPELIRTIYELYVKALLLEGHYETVVQLLTNTNTTNTTTSTTKSKAAAIQQQQQPAAAAVSAAKAVVPRYVSEALEPARLYAMYRLERYEATQKQAAAKASSMSSSSSNNNNNHNNDTLLVQHLQAQSMYHLQEYSGASTLYHNLLRVRQEEEEAKTTAKEEEAPQTETIQLLTNLTAVACAHMVPYIRSKDELASIRSCLKQALVQLLEDQDAAAAAAADKHEEEEEDGCYYDLDLAYNVATYDLCTTTTTTTTSHNSDGGLSTTTAARTLFQNAILRATNTNADSDHASSSYPILAKEVASLEWNSEWSRWLWHGGCGSTTTTTAASGGGKSLVQTNTTTTKQLPMASRMIVLANQALVRAAAASTTTTTTATTNGQAAAASAANEALRLLPQPSSTLFTPLQNCLLYYNRAALQCQAKQYADCLRTCQEWTVSCSLATTTSTFTGTKKTITTTTTKKNTPPAAANAASATTTATTAAPSTKVKIILSPLESLFWNCRIAVLEALCLLRSNTNNNNTATKETIQRLDGQLALVQAAKNRAASNQNNNSNNNQDEEEDDELIRHLMLYLHTHRAAILAATTTASAAADTAVKRDFMISFLTKELPCSYQQENAVIATLASLYHQAGREEDAMTVFQSLLHTTQKTKSADTNYTTNNRVVAGFWLTQGRYQEVLDLLVSSSDATKDPMSRALWIQALSHLEPERAYLEWTKLEAEHNSKWNTAAAASTTAAATTTTTTTGAQLEVQALPRLKHIHHHHHHHPTTTKATTNATTSAAVSSTLPNKKSQEAILRRRARQREAYLAELERKGRVLSMQQQQQQPDPERWLPKYERSYNNRRRRGNNRQQNNNSNPQQHLGAQGGVSEREAQKLDVAARQRGDAMTTTTPTAVGKSTAHMTAVVSGGTVASSKGGGRRKQ